MAPNSELKNLIAQFSSVPKVSGVDLTGRNVIVTGGSGGLGLESALVFAKLNPARLIITARSLESGGKAVEQIFKATGYRCETWVLNLMDLKSVEAFATKAKTELERLDVLLSNAGVAATQYIVSAHGYESGCQVNNISNSLLCLLLLPLLIQTATLPPPIGSKSPKFTPRITIVSSVLHYKVKTLPVLGAGEEGRTLELMSEKKRFSNDTYQDTKAINLLNAQTLISLLPPVKDGNPTVLINTVDPGFCDTGILRTASGFFRIGVAIATALVARTAEAGARNLVYASLKETSQGAYIATCKEQEAGDFVIGEKGRQVGAMIWEEMKSIWMKEGIVYLFM
ncbi:hypothetical protein BDY24DRAFT_440995 [Mrakia frigida]|uniref:uncharacterized protein n=1 Tax=Mrakia frigida TaxID=29902 RepID=UPI003FCC0F05